jgi:hypothetical protein
MTASSFALLLPLPLILFVLVMYDVAVVEAIVSFPPAAKVAVSACR